MRIAVITSTARVVGGAETYLAVVMPALQASGHDLALLCEYDGAPEHQRIAGTARIPVWCAEAMGEAATLRNLAEWRPEIIFCQGLESVELEARTGRMAPLVSMVHDYRGSCVSGSKTYRWPNLKACSRALGPGCLGYFYPRRCGGLHPLTMIRDYHTEVQRLAELQRSALILTSSEHMRNEYLKYPFEPDRIRCVGYPIPPIADAESASSGGDDRLPCRILFAGRFEYLKGASVLLKAMPRVVAALGRELRLRLAGDGRERAALEAQAARIAASERRVTIEFCGWLDAAQIQAEYRSADLLAMPSLWPEPFGLAGPEAGLNGVPVAAFATGGIPEWLIDGRNGYLAPANPPTADGLAAAIIECLCDPARHRRMRLASIELASRFSVERHIGKLNEIFAEVACQRASHVASN